MHAGDDQIKWMDFIGGLTVHESMTKKKILSNNVHQFFALIRQKSIKE